MRNIHDGLWDINLSSANSSKYSTTLTANAIIRKDKTKSALADYLHACAFSPALPTFQKAIRNNNFVTWPSITSINFENFITDKTAMYFGHLDQIRSNLQLTKQKSNWNEDFFPKQDPTVTKTYQTILNVIAFSPKEFSSYKNIIFSSNKQYVQFCFIQVCNLVSSLTYSIRYSNSQVISKGFT